MSHKHAKKIRQAMQDDLTVRVKAEAWNFFSAVAVMSFKARLVVAWTVLFYKGEKPISLTQFKDKGDKNVPMSGLQAA